ncbi:unnamed protein product [Sphagnum tenellum]
MVGIQGRFGSGFGFDSRRTSLWTPWPPPCKDLLLAAHRSSFHRAEAHLPVVADRRDKEEIPLQEEHGLSKFANPKDIQVGFYKLETGGEMWSGFLVKKCGI